MVWHCKPACMSAGVGCDNMSDCLTVSPAGNHGRSTTRMQSCTLHSHSHAQWWSHKAPQQEYDVMRFQGMLVTDHCMPASPGQQCKTAAQPHLRSSNDGGHWQRRAGAGGHLRRQLVCEPGPCSAVRSCARSCKQHAGEGGECYTRNLLIELKGCQCIAEQVEF